MFRKKISIESHVHFRIFIIARGMGAEGMVLYGPNMVPPLLSAPPPLPLLLVFIQVIKFPLEPYLCALVPQSWRHLLTSQNTEPLGMSLWLASRCFVLHVIGLQHRGLGGCSEGSRIQKSRIAVVASSRRVAPTTNGSDPTLSPTGSTLESTLPPLDHGGGEEGWFPQTDCYLLINFRRWTRIYFDYLHKYKRISHKINFVVV